MLDDPVTAQYTHTLTVTKRIEGRYTCKVANDVSCVSSKELDVRGKTERGPLLHLIQSPLRPSSLLSS